MLHSVRTIKQFVSVYIIAFTIRKNRPLESLTEGHLKQIPMTVNHALSSSPLRPSCSVLDFHPFSFSCVCQAPMIAADLGDKADIHFASGVTFAKWVIPKCQRAPISWPCAQPTRQSERPRSESTTCLWPNQLQNRYLTRVPLR